MITQSKTIFTYDKDYECLIKQEEGDCLETRMGMTPDELFNLSLFLDDYFEYNEYR